MVMAPSRSQSSRCARVLPSSRTASTSCGHTSRHRAAGVRLLHYWHERRFELRAVFDGMRRRALVPARASSTPRDSFGSSGRQTRPSLTSYPLAGPLECGAQGGSHLFCAVVAVRHVEDVVHGVPLRAQARVLGGETTDLLVVQRAFLGCVALD